jgi:hypothetical protein
MADEKASLAQLSSTISKLFVEQVADAGSTLYGPLPTTVSEYDATMEVEMKTRRSNRDYSTCACDRHCKSQGRLGVDEGAL